MTLKLISVDTIPQLDPYHADTNGQTWTKFYLTEGGDYGITQEYGDNSTPADEWHGQTQAAKLDIRPDEGAARAYLTSSDGLALLERVHAGHVVEWDGNNHVGHLDDDATAAWDELIADLNDLPECEWEFWSIDDWAGDFGRQNVTAETTNQELHELAEELVETARMEKVILNGSELDYLTNLRNEAARSESDTGYLTCAQAARLVGVSASHMQRLLIGGEISAKKAGRDWLIRPEALGNRTRKRSPRKVQ